MNASNKLLDKFAEVCQLRTDSEIGLRLKVSKQAVSGWRNEKSHPNAASVETMCKAIEEPLRKWLPLIEAERSRTPSDKQVWLRLAQTAAAVAMTFGLLNVQTVVTKSAGSFSQNPGTLYIM